MTRLLRFVLASQRYTVLPVISKQNFEYVLWSALLCMSHNKSDVRSLHEFRKD